MECSEDEANPQESTTDSQAASHSPDPVVSAKNTITTHDHYQLPKSALLPGDLPTTEHAKTASLAPKPTSTSTSDDHRLEVSHLQGNLSPSTSGELSDNPAAH
jgi:hypothetical protein